MIRSSFYGFSTAQTALAAAQKALDVVGQNMANIHTPGYTRQRLDLYSASSGGHKDLYATQFGANVGQGVVIGAVSQIRDPFLDLRFRAEICKVGEQGAILDTLNDLESVFDEISSDGLSNQMSDLIAQLNAMKTGDSSVVRASADTLTRLFNNYAKQVQKIQEGAEHSLKDIDIPAINNLLKGIANLNKSIRTDQITGNPSLELLDQRNMMLDELAAFVKIDITYTPHEISPGVFVEDMKVSLRDVASPQGDILNNEKYSEFSAEKDALTGEMEIFIGKSDETLDTLTNEVKSLLDTIKKSNTILATIGTTINSAETAYKTAGGIFDNATTAHDTANNNYTNANTAYTKALASITTANSNINKAYEAINEAKKLPQGTDAEKAEAAAKLAEAEKKLADSKVELTTAKKAEADAIKDRSEKKTLLNTAKKALTEATSNKDKAKATWDAATAKQTSATTNLTSAKTKLNAGLPNIVISSDNKTITTTIGDPATTINLLDNNVVSTGALSEIKKHFGATDVKIEVGKQLLTGSLKGSLAMLNEAGTYGDSNTRGVPYYEKILDTMANKLVDVLNTANSISNEEAIIMGPPAVAVKRPLLEFGGDGTKTAANLKIADDWASGKYGITNTKLPASPDDNTMANDNILKMIAELNNPKMEFRTPPANPNDPDDKGTLIFTGSFQKCFGQAVDLLVSDIDTTTKMYKNYSSVANNVADSIAGVSGVNLDEEGMDMMKYQKSYNAAARLMTTLDEAIDTIINKMGIVGR